MAGKNVPMDKEKGNVPNPIPKHQGGALIKDRTE